MRKTIAKQCICILRNRFSPPAFPPKAGKALHCSSFDTIRSVSNGIYAPAQVSLSIGASWVL